MLVPIGALAAITVTIGVAAEPFIDFSIRAANQLLEPRAYMEAVMGVMPVPAVPPNLMKEISP
jgi:multicomponent Na+:H+ antiporter subunit D